MVPYCPRHRRTQRSGHRESIQVEIVGGTLQEGHEIRLTLITTFRKMNALDPILLQEFQARFHRSYHWWKRSTRPLEVRSRFLKVQNVATPSPIAYGIVDTRWSSRDRTKRIPQFSQRDLFHATCDVDFGRFSRDFSLGRDRAELG